MTKIFLWSGSNPIAKTIQWFTGSKWSHCGFVLDNGIEILDSDWGWFPWTNGVLFRDFKSYLKYPDRLKIIELPFTREENSRIMDIAASYVGYAYYDLPLVFSFMWEWLEGDKYFNNMVHMKKGFTCSELIAHCIQKATGKPVIEGRPSHTIRPHELEVLGI